MNRAGCALLFGFIAASAEAQPAARPAVLRGFVLVDSTEAPIVDAEVTIDALKLSVKSVAEGAFRLPSITPGTHIVGIRALGYQPILVRLTFADGDSLERDFLMLRSAVAIAGVRVTGKADSHNPKLAEFDRRRSGGIGHFITQERIDSFPGRRLSNLMASLPGLSIQHGKGANATWAVGTRGSGSLLRHPSFSPFDAARGAKRGTCYSAVVLDGVFVYRGNEGEMLFDIDQLPPESIGGIEYYASAAQMPPELNATTTGTCGTVVIWTK